MHQQRNHKLLLCAIFKPIKYAFLTIAITQLAGCASRNASSNSSGQIIITADFSKYFYGSLQNIFTFKEEMDITYQQFPDAAIHPTTFVSTSRINDDKKVAWLLHTDKTIRVSPPFGSSIILKPGDSIHISYLYDYPIYSGNNSPATEMLSAIMKTEERLIKPRKKNNYNVKSLEDYLEWNQYLDQKLALQMPIFNAYKNKISLQEYVYYITTIIGGIESNRVNAFQAFMGSVKDDSTTGLNTTDLCQIWDSTQYKPTAKWLRSFTTYYGSASDIYAFNKVEIYRHFEFDSESDSIVDKSLRTYQYYTSAQQKYGGQMREKLLTHVLDESTIAELGLKNPIAQALLKDYYSSPGFPEYKQIVKNLEEVQMKKEAEKEKKEKAGF